MGRASELGLNVKDVKPGSKTREVVAKTFNQIGISVPVDSALDVGYRPLPMSNGKLDQPLVALRYVAYYICNYFRSLKK